MKRTLLQSLALAGFTVLTLLAAGFSHAGFSHSSFSYGVFTDDGSGDNNNLAGLHAQGSLQRVASKQVISREEAAKRAQSKHGGRVISVQLIEKNNKDNAAHYRVKLLSDGNLRVVNIKASR